MENIAAKHEYVKEHRGIGLMQGLECNGSVGEIIQRAIQKGLLLINAGPNIIRFIPPLIAGREDVDAMAKILETKQSKKENPR